MTKELLVTKKKNAKFWRAGCAESAKVLKNLLQKKTFSDAMLDCLETAGYKITKTIDKNDYLQKPSTISKPHFRVFYEAPLWHGMWLSPKTGQNLAPIIHKNTKKEVLEELLHQEIDIRINSI